MLLTNMEDLHGSKFCIDKESGVDEYGAACLDCELPDRKLGIADLVIAANPNVCIEHGTQRRECVSWGCERLPTRFEDFKMHEGTQHAQRCTSQTRAILVQFLSLIFLRGKKIMSDEASCSS